VARLLGTLARLHVPVRRRDPRGDERVVVGRRERRRDRRHLADGPAVRLEEAERPARELVVQRILEELRLPSLLRAPRS
jgi:hypothetical protein